VAGGWPRSRRPKNQTEGAPGPSLLGTGETPDLNRQEEAHGLTGSAMLSADSTPNPPQNFSRTVSHSFSPSGRIPFPVLLQDRDPGNALLPLGRGPAMRRGSGSMPQRAHGRTASSSWRLLTSLTGATRFCFSSPDEPRSKATSRCSPYRFFHSSGY